MEYFDEDGKVDWDAVYAEEMGYVAHECEKCGEYLIVGAWPFCASRSNPGGHERGAYGWKMKVGMGTQGWSRREK